MSIPTWRCLNHMEDSKWGNWNPIPLSLLTGFFSQRALGAGLLASYWKVITHPLVGPLHYERSASKCLGDSRVWHAAHERLVCSSCSCAWRSNWTEWYGRPSAIAFFLGVLPVSSSIDHVWLLNGSLSLFGYIQESANSWAMASTLKMGSKIAGSNSAPEGTLYYLVSGLLQETDHSRHIQLLIYCQKRMSVLGTLRK